METIGIEPSHPCSLAYMITLERQNHRSKMEIYGTCTARVKIILLFQTTTVTPTNPSYYYSTYRAGKIQNEHAEFYWKNCYCIFSTIRGREITSFEIDPLHLQPGTRIHLAHKLFVFLIISDCTNQTRS